MVAAASLPVLPTMNAMSTIQDSVQNPLATEAAAREGNGDEDGQTVSQGVAMFSQRDPFLMRLNRGDGNAKLSNRPSSTVLMQLGDKDTKKMIKKRLDGIA